MKSNSWLNTTVNILYELGTTISLLNCVKNDQQEDIIKTECELSVQKPIILTR